MSTSKGDGATKSVLHVLRGAASCRAAWLLAWGPAHFCLGQKTPAQWATPLPAPTPQKVERVEKVEAVASVQAGYRLSANDLVHIRVFQEEELETVARVGRDGTIPFPLLGTIGVGGKTLPETTNAISTALKEYLVRPQVAVRVVEYTKRKFTVLGQVNRPGTFDLPDDAPLSLLEGIGLAGGYTRLANSSRVTVKRSLPGMPEQVFKLDARQMARGKNAPRFQLQPGDTVMVEESLF
jgi:protein involved in polysaccharide export with SLBB domain